MATLTIIILSSTPPAPTPLEWPEVRSDYSPDESWQFIDGEWKWTDFPDIKGGGRYKENIVVFTVDENGLGKILRG